MRAFYRDPGCCHGSLPGFIPLFDVVCFDCEDVVGALERELATPRPDRWESMMCR
jgi:hypothetical protein